MRKLGSDLLPNDGVGTSGSAKTLPEKPGASTSEYQRLFPKACISQHLKPCLEIAATDNLTPYPQEFGSPLWLSLSELAPTGPEPF